MLRISCNDCGADAYVDCVPGCEQVPGTHLPGCPGADLDAAVTCAPGSGCCQEDHSHPAQANACPDVGLPFGERHGGAACPEPLTCVLWRNINATALALGEKVPPCPGGHCHKDIPECTVCRHLTISPLPGSVQVTPAIGA